MTLVNRRKYCNADRSCWKMVRSTLVWMTLLLLSSPWTIVAESSAPVPVPVPVPETETIEEGSSETKELSKQLLDARFVHKTIIIPHDSKKFRGGEDAASTIDTMLVVSDGVGGWANKGVNPGLYSQKLTETITSIFSNMTPAEQASVDLRKLMHKSNHIAADAHLGSATCTVVRLKDATTLETANVGDSGYSIHRRRAKVKTDSVDDQNLELVYASIPGQKGFNFPFQVKLRKHFAKILRLFQLFLTGFFLLYNHSFPSS